MSDARSLVVIGGGVAGTAAAWRAASNGWNVTCVFEHGGASALVSGALAPGADVDANLRRFSDALGLWTLDAETRLATSSGAVVSAAGRDCAVLDLHALGSAALGSAALGGKVVAVLDVPRAGWDAAWLARSLNEASGGHGVRYEARAVPLVLDAAECQFGDVDLALLFDEPERQRRFADGLRGASSGVGAWLVGPWLGTRPGAAAAIQTALGLPIGEPCSPIGGVSGVRWERARDALFQRAGVRVLCDHVRQIARTSGRTWCLDLATRSVETGVLEASAVVVAIGGIAGGGIQMSGDLALPSFVPSLDLPTEPPLDVAFGELHTRRVAVPGPPDIAQQGAAILERVGLRSEAASRLEGLAVAGDVVFGASRDLLSAARSGLRAVQRLGGE